ncbi:SIS domain-containing protein [Vibrio sp. B1Z05]|uniref:KpsF/GutQ family sugar-phosphate isomerase n=1 Tax=Vibrio sp. B1Z05 TaxID=2654980 RepID=UPI00128E111D|nr:KpsF/GutQ family sugar-phosphate isomerase [Vibrio sp. B1Z05]MPW36252.1 KpsF/GutQ family sugar-phosphate isomerase [Vibrio sp. B1Z05]
MTVLERAKDVLQIEIAGLEHMSNQLDSSFECVVDAILNTAGRAIICGMGKSGIIGKKIAASFASTGTPSFFMHPGEAFHGDLGMVRPEDVFIAISNSGETDEVLKLLPFLRDNGNCIVGITGRTSSTLAQASHYHLNVNVPREACPLQLAPTASTTATLAMGDALTVCLMEKREFQPENFARFHPGGSLGRRLLGKVSDEMITENLPIVGSNAPFHDVINTISSGKVGLAVILDSEQPAIITDGDLRRTMELKGKDAFDSRAMDIATANPISVAPEVSIQSAYKLMDDKYVNALLVFKSGSLVGLLKK